MFTGIIEDIGTVSAVAASEGARRFTLATTLADEPMALGASLAIDGTCLTVVEWHRGRVALVVGPETLERTTLGALAAGARVNLERPMRLGDRLGGHMVAGHVDGIGRIAARRPRGEAVDITVTCAPALLRYVIEKGSIAIDGISLTVNAVDGSGLTVSLIPHTQHATTLSVKPPGAFVNLEVDLIGKYVEKLVAPNRDAHAATPGGTLTIDKLK